jgi:lipid-binding SYLF domain-containing protein
MPFVAVGKLGGDGVVIMYMNRVAVTLSVLLSALLMSVAAAGQKVDKDKLDNASRRSGNAAKVLTAVTGLPGETIPRELLDRAKAVGVFPGIDKVNLLIEQAAQGYGVVCRRLPGGWSPPAYYAFGAADIGFTSVGAEKPDVIILFMTDKAVEAFQKGGVKFKGEMVGFAGPVGALNDEKENSIRAANVVVYISAGGKVKGVKVGGSFFKDAVVNPDNNLNQAVYGFKGREVLSGKEPLRPSVLPTVSEYRDALVSLSKP